ncbi:MAG: discoidin domain-containing protein [Verrucomicrobiae bacterium]|nr:discoidin domain-containing protein [Verrucomicrobiae bacterium]
MLPRLSIRPWRHLRRVAGRAVLIAGAGLGPPIGIAPAQEPEKAPPAESAPFFGLQNLALGQAAAASTEDLGDRGDAAFANDGDEGTRWRAARSRAGEWWQVDLGEPKPLRAAALRWEDADGAYRYRLEASADGISWRELADFSKNRTPRGLTVHRFAEAEAARYVRVVFLGADAGQWAGLREFAAWSDAGAGAPFLEKAGEAPPPPIEPERRESNGHSTTIHTPLVTPSGAGTDPLLATIRVPEDWSATVFARPPEVSHPVFVKAAGEPGAVFVATDPNGATGRATGRGKVLLIRDTDGDGAADVFHEFIPRIDTPRGLEWDGEWLYVMHAPTLSAWRDTDGDGVADEERRLVEGIGFGLEDRPGENTSNGVTLGLDGWLYLAIGDYGFLKATGADGVSCRLRGGGVARVRTDGTGLHVFSRGTRNLYEIALSPGLTAAARGNTNDGAGWETRLHAFTGFEHHGYPSLFRDFEDSVVPPVAEYGPGAGAGAVWLSGKALPLPWTGAPATCDWGRNLIYRHDVRADGAGFRETAQHEFIAIPLPVDLDLDGTGRIYVASWRPGESSDPAEGAGFVASILPPGWKSGAPPAAVTLASPGLRERVLASRDLLRSGRANVPDLEALAIVPESGEETAAAAIFTLAQLDGSEASDALVRLAGSESPAIRRLAIRAFGDRPEAKNHPLFRRLPAEKDAAALREFIVALGRGGSDDSDLVGGLLKIAGHDDPVVAHTAVETLAALRAVNTCFKCLDDKARYREWPGAFRALARLPELTVVYGLIDRFKKTDSSLIRAGAVRALCRLYFREGDWAGDPWGARPDTAGPFFDRSRWEGTPHIDTALRAALKDRRIDKTFILSELGRHRIDLGHLKELLVYAAEIPELEPAAVRLLLDGAEEVPDALPFLTFLATNENRAGELRLLAATGLARSADDMAVAAALETAAEREALDALPATRARVLAALLANPTHGGRTDWLLEEAFGPNENAAALAWALLLRMSERDSPSPVIRGEIERAIAQARARPGTFVVLLRGLAESAPRGFEGVVREGLKSKDARVAAAAREAEASIGKAKAGD